MKKKIKTKESVARKLYLKLVLETVDCGGFTKELERLLNHYKTETSFWTYQILNKEN